MKQNLLSKLLLCLSIGMSLGCAAQAPVVTDASTDSILVVVNDPRPERLRQFKYGQRYASPIAYDQDPSLKRYSQDIAADYGQEVLLEWPLRSLAVHCFVIARPSDDVLKDMQNDARIKWIQPFNQHQVQSQSITPATEIARMSQHLGAMTGDTRGVRISVIDTGADLSHRDLNNTRIEYSDFVNSHGDGSAEKHGTSVLGLLAAQPDNDAGLVQGFAANATMQHLRGCWEETGQGRCNTLTLALALEAALTFRPAVVNLSLTGPRDRVLDALVAELADQGTIVVSAYDERRDIGDRFPSPAANVLFAAAGPDLAPHLEHDHTFWAPGEAMSLSPMNDYSLVTGHSVAAPYLTAIVARLKGQTNTAQGPAIIEALRTALQTAR